MCKNASGKGEEEEETEEEEAVHVLADGEGRDVGPARWSWGFRQVNLVLKLSCRKATVGSPESNLYSP